MPLKTAFPTIGFLSTWSVYQGATIDSYTHTLLQGISAAARERGCNLLLGCGISLAASPRTSRTAWSVAGAEVDFIPVGPWNVDGLIIIPDDLTKAQYGGLRQLVDSDFPIVMTTAEIPGLVAKNSHLVAVDNAGGIRHAMQHLLHHGHKRIAFVAGKSGHGGDSAERLTAYKDLLHEAGLNYNSRLVAFGEHRHRGGRTAMREILDAGAEFTAVLASNDLSGLGALDVLRESGRRVPEDVALVGFDDILEARSQLPPLTTVRHPTFALGYQAVVSLYDVICGGHPQAETRIPTQIVVRQSCGCRPESATPKISLTANDDLHTLAHAMAQGAVIEARHSSIADIEPLCHDLVRTFLAAVESMDETPFNQTLAQLTTWLDNRAEDAYAWHAAFSILSGVISSFRLPASNVHLAISLLDRARVEIAEQAHRQGTEALLQHMSISSRLGLMTAQLLAGPDTAALNESESTRTGFEHERAILEEHLPPLGIENVLVAVYTENGNDPFGRARVWLGAGSANAGLLARQEFSTRHFPPENLYERDTPYQLALLPLYIDERAMGFVALSLTYDASLTSLESCAAITHNLGSALRSSRLYREALEGRRLAEEANRIKSRFLSTVSHELRTPLSLIVGLSDMVLQQNDYALSPTAQRDLKQIYTSAQHLGRLINDVLDLASSEAGQLRLQREPLALAAELNAMAEIGAQMAREKNLQWRANVSTAHGRVLGDRTRLRQIILNLLSNAVKFTPRGMVALQAQINSDTATISVSDTGIGISAQEQPTLFREFQRIERASASGPGGMGLGLAITKQLVEQHGGTIGVRSPGDLGGGSTFFFTLPLARPGTPGELENDLLAYALESEQGFMPFTPELLEGSLKPDAAGDADSNRHIILVVDDDPGILTLHCRLVEQQGHRAIAARSGHEALQVLETTRPSLVLLDLMMPELDGFHVLDALQARETTRDIPVIVLTARALDEADIERLNRGVTAIMAKGLFRTQETVKQIQAALERQRALGSPTRQLVRRTMGFMHAHYSEALTREQIAAHINISPDYLTDCFRQEVGVTPMVYLNRYRLKQARELLENSDLKIIQIAHAVGFSESAHFTRMFQREVGVTPRAYRQGKRG